MIEIDDKIVSADLLRECAERRSAAASAPPVIGTLIELAPRATHTPTGPEHDAADAALVSRIAELIATEIAPALRNDGGDIEFVRYRDLRVHVRLTGNCAACRSSAVSGPASASGAHAGPPSTRDASRSLSTT